MTRYAVVFAFFCTAVMLFGGTMATCVNAELNKAAALIGE